jgi:hypothetical protein
MNQLFRSAPTPAPTPEQAFGNQAAAFQRQISQGRGTNGAVLNNHPVPLELSSNLLPVMPSGGHLALGADVAPAAPQAGQQPGQPSANPAALPASPAQATKPGAAPPDQKAIAQKMMEALDKYEQLKKQEQQQDSGQKADPAKLDLSL